MIIKAGWYSKGRLRARDCGGIVYNPSLLWRLKARDAITKKKILFRLTFFLFYFSVFTLGADRVQSYLEGRHTLPHRNTHSWICWIPRWIWNSVRAGETQEISHLESKILLLEYSCGYFNLEMNKRRWNHDSYCEISNAQRKHSKVSRKKNVMERSFSR